MQANHRKIDTLLILKSIEQSDQPFALCRGQDIAFSQNVSYLVQLEEELFAHDLQSTDLLCVSFGRKIHLPVATLADLGEDLEVTVAESGSSLAEIGPFPSKVLALRCFVLFCGCFGRRRDGRFEHGLSALPIVDIAEEIEIMV